jgi:hypothetical protein
LVDVEAGSHSLAQTGLKLILFLSQPPRCYSLFRGFLFCWLLWVLGFLFIFGFDFCNAEDGTQCLAHARQVLYYWIIPPVLFVFRGEGELIVYSSLRSELYHIHTVIPVLLIVPSHMVIE